MQDKGDVYKRPIMEGKNAILINDELCTIIQWEAGL